MSRQLIAAVLGLALLLAFVVLVLLLEYLLLLLLLLGSFLQLKRRFVGLILLPLLDLLFQLFSCLHILIYMRQILCQPL